MISWQLIVMAPNDLNVSQDSCHWTAAFVELDIQPGRLGAVRKCDREVSEWLPETKPAVYVSSSQAVAMVARSIVCELNSSALDLLSF